MRYSERVTPVVRFDQGSCSILMSAHYASATFANCGMLIRPAIARGRPGAVVSRALLDAAPLADRLWRVR